MIKIFRVFIPAGVIGLILSELLLIYLCYLAGSALITPLINSDFSLRIFFGEDSGFIRISIAVLCIVAGLYFQDLYSHFRIKTVTVLVQQICLVIGGSFLVQAFLS